jgi:Ulp1 family protease
MDGIKSKTPTKTSHCLIGEAPKKDVLHFPNAAQSMLVQQQRMDGPNNERQLFSRKRNVYVADLDCLQNETWLYEHVIMMFLDFEHQHHENILLLDFEMYNCWLQRTLQLGVSYDHLDVMSEFVVFNTQIYQFVMWIVPIHENNHYQLLIITNPRWPSRIFLF